jgi:hypothetical protein
LVTCLPTYRTMARYFEFLSQFYGFHLTHPRRILEIHVKNNAHQTLKGKPAELQTLIKGVAD